ncbi:MAG: hypothetical protein ACFB21_12535, partial [Opitutales bacterium]
LALAGLALPLAASAALVGPGFSGNTEFDGWDNLTSSNYTPPTYPVFPGTDPWLAPIGSTVAGSAGNAVFDKVSGGGYPATQAIYNFTVPGTFEVVNSAPLSGLETVLLQLDLGIGETFFRSQPLLNYNGGAQALAADFDQSVAGPTSFTNPQTGNPATTTLFGYQWDLSGVSEAITEYEIEWTTAAHATTFQLRLDSSDDFTGNQVAAALPEPGFTGVLLGLGVMLLAHRRRT